MQMKPYLLGQGVFHFVDGLLPCPSSYVSNGSAGSSSTISLFFLLETIGSIYFECIILLSLRRRVASYGRLPYLAMCWRTFEKAPTSLYNSRIMQLHDSFQDLRQGDSSINIYM